MATISIIIPVYNVEKYLNRCVVSVLAQTYSDFEVILVDDGSPDNSGVMCDSFAEKDKRIKVIHRENGGLSAARNSGLAVADGEYVYFLDSDDFIHPQCLEIHLKSLLETDSDISIAKFEKFDVETDISLQDYTSDYSVTPMKNVDALARLAGEVEFVIACNKLYKKSLFDKILFPEGKVHEDEFVAHHLLYKAQRVVFSDAVLYFYFQNSSGITNSKYNAKRLDAIEAFDDRVDFYKKHKLENLYNDLFFEYMEFLRTQYFKVVEELGDKELAEKVKEKFKKVFSQAKQYKKYEILRYKKFYILAYPVRTRIFLKGVSFCHKVKNIVQK